PVGAESSSVRSIPSRRTPPPGAATSASQYARVSPAQQIVTSPGRATAATYVQAGASSGEVASLPTARLASANASSCVLPSASAAAAAVTAAADASSALGELPTPSQTTAATPTSAPYVAGVTFGRFAPAAGIVVGPYGMVRASSGCSRGVMAMASS